MNIDLSLILMDLVLNFVTIILLFIIVKTLLFKPVKNFLDSRSKKIQDSLKDAEDNKKAALALKEEYNSLIKNSQDEVKKIIKDGELKAAEKSALIIDAANKQAEKILAEAKEKIAEERKDAQEDIKKEIVRTAVQISEKILEREIRDSDIQKIAEDYFSNPGGRIV
ncbi:MAG: F0F1 ATP synthase subunit B [Clostridia bacterium]|nr:F0F1 ATP synthase subunit B [Clostridia bacterium]